MELGWDWRPEGTGGSHVSAFGPAQVRAAGDDPESRRDSRVRDGVKACPVAASPLPPVGLLPLSVLTWFVRFLQGLCHALR